MQKHKTIPVTTALLFLGVTWGGAFVLMKVLVDELSPAQIVGARLSLGALVVTAVLFARSGPTVSRDIVMPAALLCLIDNVVPNGLVAWSQTRIESGDASVFMSTMPLFTTVFAVLALNEGISLAKVVGLVLGFFGVVIVSDGAVLDVTSHNGAGILAVIGAAASHASAAVYTRVLLRRFDPLRLTAFKLGAGALMTAPVVLATDDVGAYATMSPQAVLALVLLGAVATGAAYGLYIWVVGAAGAVHASLVTYIIPAAGLGLAWSILGEPVGAHALVGAAVIVSGVALVMFGERLPLSKLRLRPAGAQPVEASA